MTTAIMGRVELARPAVSHDKRPRTRFDVLAIVRPCAQLVAACSLSMILPPLLAVVAAFALPCLPFALPFVVLAARNVVPACCRARSCAGEPKSAPRILRGRLWEAREFA